MFAGSLIRAGNNAKTIKGDKKSQYVTAIMYLAPADLAGGKTVCPFADKAGCKAGCLNTSGHGSFNSVQQARINKTRRFLSDRTQFMLDLFNDIEKFVAKCNKYGRLPAVRLNGTSDIAFEHIPVNGYANIMAAFPQVQFYDYTKIYKRAYNTLPDNYNLTLSYSGANRDYAARVFNAHFETGTNLAVVYRTKEQATLHAEYTANVVYGDDTDLRFLDPQGSIVALYAKGKARSDKSGFVIDLDVKERKIA
jgi:hypothetical protein